MLRASIIIIEKMCVVQSNNISYNTNLNNLSVYYSQMSICHDVDISSDSKNVEKNSTINLNEKLLVKKNIG